MAVGTQMIFEINHFTLVKLTHLTKSGNVVRSLACKDVSIQCSETLLSMCSKYEMCACGYVAIDHTRSIQEKSQEFYIKSPYTYGLPRRLHSPLYTKEYGCSLET